MPQLFRITSSAKSESASLTTNFALVVIARTYLLVSPDWHVVTVITMAKYQDGGSNLLGNHLIDKCPRCPEEVKTLLKRLRLSHDNERAHMNHGAQLSLLS